MTFDFAVIIINYKTAELTKQCVRSVLNEISNTCACIVIVDNFSNDGSPEIIKQWVSENKLEEIVIFCESPVNSGFSGGNNLGITQVDANVYILLNSDTIVRPGAFGIMLDTFSLDPDIGMVSPRLEYEDGTGQISCFRYHSPASEFINVVKTGVVTKLLARFDVPIPLTDEITFPEWTSFACIAIKAEVFEDIGLMDESYFLYYEDVDYCHMANDFGWRIANNPRAHVVHLRGGSAELKQMSKIKARLPQYHFDSRRTYFCKHYGKLGFLAANLLWTLGRCISKMRETIEKKPPGVSKMEWLDNWTRKQVSIERNNRG